MKHIALALIVALGLAWSATTVEAHGPYGWGPRPAIGFYVNPVVPAPYYGPYGYPYPPGPRVYGYAAPLPPPVYVPPPVYAPPPPAVGIWFGS